jgi:hypothetical protein
MSVSGILCTIQYPKAKARTVEFKINGKTDGRNARELREQKHYFNCANYIPSYLGNIGRCGTVVAGHTTPQIIKT